MSIKQVFIPKIGREQNDEVKEIIFRTFNFSSFIDITDGNDIIAWGSGEITVSEKNGIHYEINNSFVPVFVETWNFSWDELLVVHDYARKWGDESGTYGVKFPEQLESIIARENQEFFGIVTNPTVLKRASFYWFEIATHQAFHNGNKRTAFLAMLLYLNMNGYNFDLQSVSETELYDYTVKIAEKKINQDEIYRLLFNNVHVRIKTVKEE